MDDIDLASEIEQARIAKSLNAITREVSEIASVIDCIECGDEIEEERREALPSAKRCVVCQDLHERPRRVRRF